MQRSGAESQKRCGNDGLSQMRSAARLAVRHVVETHPECTVHNRLRPDRACQACRDMILLTAVTLTVTMTVTMTATPAGTCIALHVP